MTGLSPYSLQKINLESKGCYLLQIAANHAALSYQQPGQYVQLAVQGVAPSYFAIANAPSTIEEKIELLIKASGPSASAITAVPAGGQLLMSAAQGRGFPLHKNQDALLLTMGTGISALRPLLQTMMLARHEFGKITLLHGVRAEHEAPFIQEHQSWSDANIDVRPVFSKQGGARQGRVIQYIAEALTPGVVVYLSGSKEMNGLVRLELAKHQIGPDRIMTNF